jgi:hypothetical protein
MKIPSYSSKENHVNILLMRQGIKLILFVDSWLKTLGADRVIGEKIFARVVAF